VPEWQRVIHVVPHPLAVASAIHAKGLGGDEVGSQEAWAFVCAYAHVAGCPNYSALTESDIPLKMLTVHEGVGNLLKSLAYWLGESS